MRNRPTPTRHPRTLRAVNALRLVRGGGGAGLDILIGNTGGDRLSTSDDASR